MTTLDAPSRKQIRLLTRNDLNAVTRIHLKAFPGSALTALGAETVRRYYEWQLLGPHETTALAAEYDGEFVGFCFGGIFRGALSGFLQNNRSFLIRKVITHPWLISNSLFRNRLAVGWRSLRRLKKAATASVHPTTSLNKSFGILAIAVNPQFQGKGIGKLLMTAAEIAASEKEFLFLNLTVSIDNLKAIQFYETLGWVRVQTSPEWRGAMSKTISTKSYS